MTKTTLVFSDNDHNVILQGLDNRVKTLEDAVVNYKTIVDAANVFVYGDQEKSDEHFETLKQALDRYKYQNNLMDLNNTFDESESNK